VPYDIPALRKWRYATTDSSGKPILAQGTLYVHPDALKEVKALFDKSAVKAHPFGALAMKVSGTIKSTMLDLSGFHYTQITLHALEHRVNPFNLATLNISDPESKQSRLVKSSLMIADTQGHSDWAEGTAGGSSSLLRHIPFGIGSALQANNDRLFNTWIPRIKMTMALHALERNMARYAGEIKAKRMTEDDVYYRTATEANNAFGHLNYEVMGRSKTAQDIARLALLAPDFLEARAHFVRQAFQQGAPWSLSNWGPLGSNEQRQALMGGAVAMWLTARIANKLINDEYHFEPENVFSVVIGGRSYGLRTVQGDLIHVFTKPANFAATRLNPVTLKPLMEAVYGRDQFGRLRTPEQQALDLAKTAIPISLRHNPEQTLLESIGNALGVQNKRYSAIADVHKMVEEFKKANNITSPVEMIYNADNDPYHLLKTGLALGNDNMAFTALRDMIDGKTVPLRKIYEYFREYPHHAFTGSRANDAKMVAGLSEDQRKIYNDAVQERKDMAKNFFRIAALVQTEREP